MDVEPKEFSKCLEAAFDEELKLIIDRGLPYIVYLWKTNKCMFFRGSKEYMQSLEEKLATSHE